MGAGFCRQVTVPHLCIMPTAEAVTEALGSGKLQKRDGSGPLRGGQSDPRVDPMKDTPTGLV